MFYMIKHVPTGTWVPQLQSSRDRSHYYSFLEGKKVTTKPVFNADVLDFKKGFKYKEPKLAGSFIEKLPKKLKIEQSPEQVMAMFKITSFKKYPIEELELCFTSAEPSPDRNIFVVDSVKPNWLGFSDVHCDKCGALLPPEMKYLTVFSQKFCPFCISEVYEILKDAADDLKSKDNELFEEIQTARFVQQI